MSRKIYVNIDQFTQYMWLLNFEYQNVDKD